MQNLNEHNITDEVVRRFENTPNPRLREIMTSLVKHMHAFAREVHLTEDEWFQGIQFVTGVGQKCDDKRQEFILLSDTLGLSQLVVAQNHKRPKGVTEQTVFGPFHLNGAPHLAPGSNIAAGVEGEPCFVTALVKAANGTPVVGATVDVWQADADGLYDVQHPEWQEMKLRAVFKTDHEGRFRLRTIKPCSYPVPTGGPVGNMLRALHQNPYRPAHLHVMINAEGYDRLITHVFVQGDSYLDSDAVFGVRSSCIGNYVRRELVSLQTAPGSRCRFTRSITSSSCNRWPEMRLGGGFIYMDKLSASGGRCRCRDKTRSAQRSAHSREILSGQWHVRGI